MESEKFKLSDILYGFIVPLILALLIFVIAVYVNPGGTYHLLGVDGLGGTIAIIFTQGFPKMIILGVPLILGLVWNKWAGGAAGFIMGGAYYLAYAGYSSLAYEAYAAMMGDVHYNFYGDISMLFYLVNAIIIGYMAGALNNGSTNFKRMIGVGLTAAITTQIIQTFMDYNFSLEPARAMSQGVWNSDPVYAFVLAFIPSILLGVIIPILAKVMSWYGLTARKQY
ncbi:MAG: hypothetical protein ACQCN5_11515 [Candidatus Bathyarchaeia archaeon]